jgi:N-acylneuraminate cytidylyltransferase
VAFVHAKGTSDRVPRKNLRLLGDRPLFCHAIRNALASSRVELVVIDTECEEILRIGVDCGAVPLRRPPELATNRTTGDELAYWQATNYRDARIVVQVTPTSPFLTPSSIDRAIETIDSQDVDSAAGVRSEALYIWRDGRPAYFRHDGTIPNSSELTPIVHETTGLYANRTEFVLRERRRLNPDRCAPVLLSPLEAIDIDTEEDFAFAETVWRGLTPETWMAQRRVRTYGS